MNRNQTNRGAGILRMAGSLCGILGATLDVRADMSPWASPVSVRSVGWTISNHQRATVLEDFSGTALPMLYAGIAGPAFESQRFGLGVFARPSMEARPLPELPGSAGLFISALLSVGAWRVVRSARNVCLGEFPDWYHAGGPVQVGHAVPSGLDFTELVELSFEPTATNLPAAVRGFVRWFMLPRRTQCAFGHVSPRGPPRLHHPPTP